MSFSLSLISETEVDETRDSMLFG